METNNTLLDNLVKMSTAQRTLNYFVEYLKTNQVVHASTRKGKNENFVIKQETKCTKCEANVKYRKSTTLRVWISHLNLRPYSLKPNSNNLKGKFIYHFTISL